MTVRPLAIALVGLVAAGTLVASGFGFGAGESRPTSWAPRSWPPTPASPRGTRCDRVAAPSGSNRNPGTRAAPYRTPQALAEALKPGQTGCLRSGTYRGGQYVLAIQRAGRRRAPITIRSYPGERARLLGITQVTGRARWIVLSGLAFDGDGSQNTIKVYGNDVTIESSDITNRRRGLSCVLLGSAEEGVAERPLIRGNRLHDCGNPAHGNKDHGIYAAYTSSGRIAGNYFSDSAAYAIQFYPSAQGMRFDRNVIDGGGDSIRGGIVFGGDGRHASSDNLVDHNVIAFAASGGVTADWEGPQGTGNVARDNCVWEADIGHPAGFRATADVVADPEFRDRSHGDLRMPSGNRCRRVLR